MISFLIHASWLLVLASATPLAAWAQQALSAAQPAAAAAPALPYGSVFEGYEPYAQQKLLPWREANDNVGRIGGWRAYAREASPQTPGSPAQTDGKAPAPAAPAAARPHSGHGKH